MLSCLLCGSETDSHVRTLFILLRTPILQDFHSIEIVEYAAVRRLNYFIMIVTIYDI